MTKPPFRRLRKPANRPCPARLFLELLEERSLLDAGGTVPAGYYAPLPTDPGHADQTRIVVRFRPEVQAAALGGTSLGPDNPLVPGLREIELSSGIRVEDALQAYRADPQVLYAEPDPLVHVDDTVTPNDPKFGSLWNLSNSYLPGADIHAPAAWAVTTGSLRTTVAVIDTGIDYDHPDLFENIWINRAEIPASRMKNLVDVDGDGRITFWDLADPRNQGPFKITDVNSDGRIDAADILAPMVLDANGNDTGQGGWAFPGNTQEAIPSTPTTSSAGTS